MNTYGSGLTRPLFVAPSPSPQHSVQAKNDGSIQINGKIFRPVAQGKNADISTPMNEDYEKEYSYRLALSRPFLDKIAEMVDSQVVETSCVCGNDKRKKLIVHLSNVPAMIICGERARAGHKVPDSLKSAASYMAFFNKMTTYELLPPGIYDLACRKQNVAACLKILVPFMAPTMEKLKNMLQRAEIKNTNFEPLSATIGEKDTARARLCSRVQQEWGQWAKTYWSPLEQKLNEDIQAVPQANDHVKYTRKTDAEIELSREQSRLMGEKFNEESKKRKAPPATSLPQRFVASSKKLKSDRLEKILQPLVNTDYPRSYVRPSRPSLARPYNYAEPAHPHQYENPAEPHNFEPSSHLPYGLEPSALPFSHEPPSVLPNYGHSLRLYNHEPSHLFKHEPNAHPYNHEPYAQLYNNEPAPPPPPPPPEPYRRNKDAPLMREPPRRYNFFPAPPPRKALLPTPGLPYSTSDNQRRADFVYKEIKYLVGLFEERFINADGTRYPIMESPIVQRALNLDYTSLQDAEHIFSSLQKAWTEISTNNTHNISPHLPSNSNLVMFNGLTYHRLRTGEDVREGQQVLWCRPGTENFFPVTISRVKSQKAVIDFDDDMECVHLKDLYFPGF